MPGPGVSPGPLRGGGHLGRNAVGRVAEGRGPAPLALPQPGGRWGCVSAPQGVAASTWSVLLSPFPALGIRASSPGVLSRIEGVAGVCRWRKAPQGFLMRFLPY